MYIAKNRTSAKTTVYTKPEVPRGTLVSMDATGAVVGQLSFTGLIGTMIVADGPFSLAKAWIRAVGNL